ncbi:hypothetical protein JCM5296_005410 [Sporobolomyces johnsonii]
MALPYVALCVHRPYTPPLTPPRPQVGYSVWYAIPQMLKLYEAKPMHGGPAFLLLGSWLAGDIGQTIGIFLNNGLTTQKFSGMRGVFFPIDVNKKKNGRRSRNERAPDEDISTGSFRSGWKDASGPKFNITGLLLVSVVAFAVWIWQDLAGRTSKPALVASAPPADVMSWLGWSLGMAGTAAYNLPRVYQVYVIWRNKSMESIAVWSFASLILQNVTMTISILTVSHTPSSVFAQSPYILNVGLALVGDAVVVVLYRRYRGDPMPYRDDRPWTDPDWLYRDYPSGTSSSPFPSPANEPGASSDSEFYHDEHRRDLHSALFPPIPLGARQHRPLPVAQVQRKHAADARRNKLDRRALDQKRLSALKAEEDWADPSKRHLLSPFDRHQTRTQLDERVRAEHFLEGPLEKRIASSKDKDEKARHADWETRNAEVTEKLARLRKLRREADLREDGEHDSSSSSEPRQDRHPASSMDRRALSSSSPGESDSGEERRYLTAGQRRGMGQSKFHPRRGVGTSE